MSTIDLTEPGAFAKAFKANFSGNVDPCCKPSEDFYRYANGTWLKNNPIPEIYPAWGSFLMLRDVSQERCRNILNSDSWVASDSANATHTSALFNLTKSFYSAAMDEAAIEANGTAGLFDETMKKLDACGALSDVTSLVAELHMIGVPVFFHYGDTIDKGNSEWSIGEIYQSGLGLPDRDYYFDADKVGACEAYKAHLKNMMGLLGADKDAADAASVSIFDFEKAMAEKFMTKTALRDPHATYNLVTIDKLREYCPGIDWDAYFKVCHDVKDSDIQEVVGKINLATVEPLKAIGQLLSSTSISTLKLYFKWHLAHRFASHLSSAFVNEDFDFNQKQLSGTKVLKPRWKRATEMVESNLGEALGQLYVDKHFSGDAKPLALSIVENVRSALEERLHEVTWLSKKTRAAALEKMAAFRVHIGFPDKWIDYSWFAGKLGENHLQNVFSAALFHHRLTISRINKPTDKDRWFMTPQTVNAYYSPNMNLICFPAAILQPPFFDPTVDLSVNYGGMGVVVGHEMTHGFDDKGSRFDAKGNMKNWWTDEDNKNFADRVKVVIKQAEQHDVLGQKLKGELTAGENLADLGGLRLSLRALKKELGDDNLKSEENKVDGFTPVQRFFLNYATIWRENSTDERRKKLVTIDPHGPSDFRANGPLSNMPEFHEAFDIKEGNPMFKPSAERVDVW